MRTIPDAAIAAVARGGSLLALALTTWYACAALHVPFVVAMLIAVALIALVFRGKAVAIDGGVPALPLVAMTLVILSPSLLLLRAASGPLPHWLGNADEAYTLLIARGLRLAFPPPDLSWASQPIRYHLGAPMLVDLLSRLTRLPVHAAYYGVMPVVMKVIFIAAVLECARRVAPALDARLRVWVPLAASGMITIDWFAMVWQVHNLIRHGVFGGGMPAVSLQPGLFSRAVPDSSWLAAGFALVLAATGERTTAIEKAALLFTIYLVKAQIFLPVGAAFGVVALFELRKRRWQSSVAGAVAVMGVLLAQPYESTYGKLASIRIGCGAFCNQLLNHHHLAARMPPALLLPVELILFLAGTHVLLLAVLRNRREPFLVSVAAAGIVVPLLLRLSASPVLRARFLAIYAPVADRLFMPLPVYLDRIFDVAVNAALDAFVVILPVIAIPLLAERMNTNRRSMRVALGAFLAVTLAVCGYECSALGVRNLQAKEISADAMATLRAIPEGPHVVITNDFAYDDRVERHLPLLNIWAPLASGRQFYASAFMFNFQYPDAAERLRVQRGDLAFVRNDLPWDARGWTLTTRNGRYALWSRDR